MWHPSRHPTDESCLSGWVARSTSLGVRSTVAHMSACFRERRMTESDAVALHDVVRVAEAKGA